MKKLISTIFLAILLAVLVVPAISLAQTAPPNQCRITHNLTDVLDCPNGSVTPRPLTIYDDGGSEGMCCLINTVYNVTDWLFYLLLIAVVLMGVIGGVLYMTSAGNSEKAEKGKKAIIYAIIGLVLALIARLIPSVVKMILGMG